MRSHWAVGVGLAVFCIGQPVAHAQEKALSAQAVEALGRIVIQHNGRHKPFDSFARETLDAMTGAHRWKDQEPVATVFSIITDPESWQDEALIAVPFLPLREALGLSGRTTHASYNQLTSTRKLMRMLPAIVEKQQRDEKLSMLENETMDAFQRFVSLSALLEQKLELIPPPQGMGSWLPVFEPAGYPQAQQQQFQDAWVTLTAAVRSGDSPAAADAARNFAALARQANPAAFPAAWSIDLELFYNRQQPFMLARLLYMAAALLLILSLSLRGRRMGVSGFWVLAAAFTVHAAGIAMRVILGGRPPVSNFFETMLWLPFVAVALSLIFERIYRARYFAIAAGLLSAITLWLADKVPLDSSITPVVAVLRSNLWLTVHVLTIVASYGALALAVVLAHIYGWLYLVGRHRDRSLKGLGLFLYRTLQVGVVLLAGGIMLGAVWANASWGRYWGWDPKETWALITLLWYLAMLHGRFAGWLSGVGFALATIGGFFLLLMTYYGVSFYLVGLHSYAGGNAKPLPGILVGYLIAELVFLAFVGAAALRRRTA